MADFYIKKNDTLPAIGAILKDAAGDPVDLTGATVRFHMSIGSAVKVDAAATIVDAAAGDVRYDWQSGDTDTAGPARCEFEVTFPGGGVETWPNNGAWTVSIAEEIA